MTAVRMYARAALRRKVWGTVAVALLIGIAGTAVLGAFAGARRTESAFGRLLAAQHVGDISVGTQGVGHVSVPAIRTMPNVAWAEARKLFILASRADDGRIIFMRDLGSATVGASTSAQELYRRDQAQVLDGRLPDPNRVDEVAVNEVFARNRGLGVGDTYRAWLYSFDDVLPLIDHARALGRDPTDAELRPIMTPLEFRITGIARTNADLVLSETQSGGNDTVFATPAFTRRYDAKAFLTAASVKLGDPAHDTAGFERAVRKRFPELNLDIESTAASRVEFARVVDPYVQALRIFALVAAVAGLFVVGQALARLVATDSVDLATLQALGATRRQRRLSCASRAILAIAVGCGLAALGAWALSPIFPIGRARDAEPHPGLQIDGRVIVIGVVAVAVVLIALAALLAAARVHRSARAHDDVRRSPSRSVSMLRRRGGSVGIVTGVGFAVERDRRAPGSSLAATLVGIVVAIAATVAALTFATNLNALVSSPSRYGWTWGVSIESYTQEMSPELAQRIEADRNLTGLTVASRASVVVDGRTIPAYGFDHVRGSVDPGRPAGRMPRGLHEVALGGQTMRDLGVAIGDRLRLPTASGQPLSVRVVGKVLLPFTTNTGSFGLAEGMVFSTTALKRLDPSAQPGFVLADLAPGATMRAVARRYSQDANVFGASKPGDVVAYGHVRSTPLFLAALLAVLAAGVLAHVLVTAVRVRRRDLAVLKTLGFTRRQVASAIGWMATTVVVIALVVGIPVGLALGRWTWRSFADDLGISSYVLVPVAALLVLIAAAVLLANLVAALPARTAARTRPALVLRSE
jgi:ABC-type lipoprotein release transport system permease subunit